MENKANNIEYVGIDYHTKFAVATRMDKDGVILGENRIANRKEEIREYLSRLTPQSQVVLEATNNWYAFVEWSHDLPIEVMLAHPTKTKAIAEARIKTDTIDSKILADLLRSNFVAQSYLAPQKVRDVRELVRYRTTLVRVRTKFISRIHSILFKTGEETTTSDITTIKGRAEIESLPLRSIYKSEVQSCFKIIDDLKSEIAKFEDEIKRKAEVDEDTKLLLSIPGISFFSALLIVSEIGDYKRFPSSRKLCSFAGLVPSVYSSGGKTRRGAITKQGSANLRFILLQAVPHLVKKSIRLKNLYERIRRKHGKNVARIAIARKLLSIVLAMLKTRALFIADR